MTGAARARAWKQLDSSQLGEVLAMLRSCIGGAQCSVRFESNANSSDPPFPRDRFYLQKRNEVNRPPFSPPLFFYRWYDSG